MNKKELIINDKQYTIATVNKRAKMYATMQGVELPINVEEIYTKYRFDDVHNIGVVREVLRSDILNLEKAVCGSVEIYNATVINTALLPYLISTEADMLEECRATLKLIGCYDKLMEYITSQVTLLQLPDKDVTDFTILSVERNILLRGYLLLNNNAESILRMFIEKSAKFYKKAFQYTENEDEE